MTAEAVEQIFRDTFSGPFPYHECRTLAQTLQRPTAELIPELDSYFSIIAGYSSSASRLHTRSVKELHRAVELLALGFFERFPNLEAYRVLIKREKTPVLAEQMRSAELLRASLLQILSQVLADRPSSNE